MRRQLGSQRQPESPRRPSYLLQLLQAPPQALRLQAQLAGPGLGFSRRLPLLQAGAVCLVPRLCQQPQLLLQVSQALLLWAWGGAGEHQGEQGLPAAFWGVTLST